jgi:DNA segregation ATPase FtsK/SpoIIIE, S-DNA-T family
MENRSTDGDESIAFGISDDPARQTQVPAVFSPERDGSLIVFGASGSGKSTTLVSIATAASAALVDPPVEIYALDFAGRSLEPLEALPNVGSVIGADDHERITRLITKLKKTIATRVGVLAEYRAGSLSDLRRLAPEAATDMPRILVLLDGYGQFTEKYERIERGIWLDAIPRLVADGRQVGVHFVFTADRRMSIPTALFSIIPARVVLRLANADDYSNVGAPSKLLNNDSVPGRCVIDGLETQIAVAGGSTRSDEQARKLSRLACQLRRQREGRQTEPIQVLPSMVAMNDMRTYGLGLCAVSGTSLEGRPIEIKDGAFLVAGPRSSGKTNALAALAMTEAGRLDARPMFLLSKGRSTLPLLGVWAEVYEGTAACAEFVNNLAEELPSLGDANPILFIDDFHDTHETELGAAISKLLKVGREHPVTIVASADLAVAKRSGTYVPLGELRAWKSGIVLAPEQGNSDGDVLGATLPNFSTRVWPEGRGYIIEKGATELVQLALA